MRYCDVADIEAYFLNKNFNSTSAYVKNTTVETFITQDAALIDSILLTRYSLPITNEADLLILKMINEKMVVGTIDDIFREKPEAGDFERTRNLRKEALDWLTKIKEGNILLNATANASAIKFNNVDSAGNTVQKRFKDYNIEPTITTLDRERRAYVQG